MIPWDFYGYEIHRDQTSGTHTHGCEEAIFRSRQPTACFCIFAGRGYLGDSCSDSEGVTSLEPRDYTCPKDFPVKEESLDKDEAVFYRNVYGTPNQTAHNKGWFTPHLNSYALRFSLVNRGIFEVKNGIPSSSSPITVKIVTKHQS